MSAACATSSPSPAHRRRPPLPPLPPLRSKRTSSRPSSSSPRPHPRRPLNSDCGARGSGLRLAAEPAARGGSAQRAQKWGQELGGKIVTKMCSWLSRLLRRYEARNPVRMLSCRPAPQTS